MSSYDIGCHTKVCSNIETHIKSCHWVQLRPVIENLLKKIDTLEDKIDEQQKLILGLESGKISTNLNTSIITIAEETSGRAP